MVLPARPASVMLIVIVLARVLVPPVSKVIVSVADSPILRLRVAVPVPAPRFREVRFSGVPVPLSKDSVEPPDTTTEVMRPGFVSSPVSASVELPVALRAETAVTWPATVNEPPSLAIVPLLPTGTEAPKDTAVLPALMMSK